MFGTDLGTQVSWLIPAALVLLAAMLWLSRKAPRTDPQRAQVLLWGSWLVVTGLTFSYAAGIIHPYYSVALAPAIAALVGVGAVSLWRHRASMRARIPLACAVAVTTWWAYRLLDRTPTWHPSLRLVVALAGIAATVAIVAGVSRRSGAVVAAAALVATLAGPTAYALDTAATAHNGAIPSAGPSTGQGFGQRPALGGPPPQFAGGGGGAAPAGPRPRRGRTPLGGRCRPRAGPRRASARSWTSPSAPPRAE